MPTVRVTTPTTTPTMEAPEPAPGNANNSILLKGPKEAAPQVNAKGMNFDGRTTPNNHFPTLNILVLILPTEPGKIRRTGRPPTVQSGLLMRRTGSIPS